MGEKIPGGGGRGAANPAIIHLELVTVGAILEGVLRFWTLGDGGGVRLFCLS